MKTYLTLAITGLALLTASVAAAEARQPASSHAHQRHQPVVQPRAAIVAVFKSYEQALNASDVEGVVRLYTDDAVVLAPNAPSAVGIDAVRATYTGVFQAIDIDLTFKVAEVKVVSPDWAFLRSTSNGSITILANGARVPSSNQELFVLQKVRVDLGSEHHAVVRKAYSTYGIRSIRATRFLRATCSPTPGRVRMSSTDRMST